MLIEVVGGLVAAENIAHQEATVAAIERNAPHLSDQQMTRAQAAQKSADKKGLQLGAGAFALAAIGITMAVMIPALPLLGLGIAVVGGIGLSIPAIRALDEGERFATLVEAQEKYDQRRGVGAAHQEPASTIATATLGASFNDAFDASPTADVGEASPRTRRVGRGNTQRNSRKQAPPAL